jgi:hypothetical protein
MRIVQEQDHTDPEAGLLTLEGDPGGLKRYVRRSRNAPLTAVADLLETDNGRLEFARGQGLDAKNLPDRLIIGLPSGQAHEYRANERAFSIWEKFRDKTMRESGGLDPWEIKQLLDITDPQAARPWTVEEVKAEMVKWVHDKEKLT